MNGSAQEHSGSVAEPGAGASEHPSWKFYVLIGAILTVITAAEVAVFYIPALRPVLVPILLVLSAGKFALVVMFFMHLRYDANVFTGVFVAPLSLAVFVVVALIILFQVLPNYSFGG